MAKTTKTEETNKPNKKYNLYKDIRSRKYYKNNVGFRDRKSRKIISEGDVVNNLRIVPGQMISFDYMTPHTKDELEYYDAKPVTLFFNVVTTNQGKRVLGFNLHYYPPKVRYWVMNRIFEIFKNVYLKSWDTGISRKIMRFNYDFLVKQLQKYDLAFGVRMYDPKLMKNVINIPPAQFADAVFTEGLFKKKSRANILTYWGKWFKQHKQK